MHTTKQQRIEVIDMRPMIWHPEEKDQKVNQYLDSVNHAPYFGLMLGVLGVFCLFTLVILLGIF
jgi:Fe2+ transport system protein B